MNFLFNSRRRRNIGEGILKGLGLFSIVSSLGFLLFLFLSIFMEGKDAFYSYSLKLQILINKDVYIDDFGGRELNLHNAFYDIAVDQALADTLHLRGVNSEVSKISSKVSREYLGSYLSKKYNDLDEVRDKKVNIVVPVNSDVEMYLKGKKEIMGQITPSFKKMVDELYNNGVIVRHFNFNFFMRSDSRYPEFAGILSGIIGTICVVVIALAFSFVIGVMTAVYLSEIGAKDSKFLIFLEANINNLASIPSIVYGLLGFIVFINLFNLPMSSSLVGGLTLSLMALPPIIISSKLAISSVPDSLKEAAYALGATRAQVTFSYTLPYAMPGILTGLVISLSRIIGETAPLLMIGMVAFISQVPKDLGSPAVTLPVQILLWSDIPDIAYQEKASAAIIILLLILFLINGVAIYLRNKMEK